MHWEGWGAASLFVFCVSRPAAQRDSRATVLLNYIWIQPKKGRHDSRATVTNEISYPNPNFSQKTRIEKSALISECELGLRNVFCVGHPDILEIFFYLLAKNA